MTPSDSTERQYMQNQDWDDSDEETPVRYWDDTQGYTPEPDRYVLKAERHQKKLKRQRKEDVHVGA